MIKTLATICLAIVGCLSLGSPASAQAMGHTPEPLPGPNPTYADISYAPTTPATGKGHLLDIYLPAPGTSPSPVVIFTHGSGWMADNGRFDAQSVAAHLNKLGYAVVGVAIRSSGQTQFPGQLHDIKAAIRWLRANAAKYNFDPDRFAIMGESSGGWTAAITATTGDVPELEGSEGVVGPSSAVQAAIAFYPPTNFLEMDPWALGPCDPAKSAFSQSILCHRSADSPESRLVGCAIESCPEKVAAADPIRYITPNDPPIMIIHGAADALVPHAQGEALYQALNKACHEAAFISMPLATHGVWDRMLTRPDIQYGSTIQTSTGGKCDISAPKAVTPNWQTLVQFLETSFGK